MSWLFYSLIAYLLNSVSILVDKVLLRKDVPEPAAFTFFVSFLSGAAIVLLPFVPLLTAPDLMIIAIGAGLAFTAALYAFYAALQRGEASRVAPLVGGLSPLFVLWLAEPILGEYLPGDRLVAFLLIVAGSWFAMREKHESAVPRPSRAALLGILSAFLFALSHVLSKFVYVNYDFWGGLAWRSLGTILGALLLFVIPQLGPAVRSLSTHARDRAGALFFVGQAAGAVSFILLNYAFTLGSIALVNALAGTQYLFLFGFILLAAIRSPHLLDEHLSRPVLLHKMAGILLISAGLALLFV
jgi:uncharacterized membrane protein